MEKRYQHHFRKLGKQMVKGSDGQRRMQTENTPKQLQQRREPLGLRETEKNS